MLKQDLRIVFMGTPDYAKGSLEALVDNAFNIVGVFCQPDKPKGRGMKLMAPPVKEYAISKGISVYQPVKLRNNDEVKEILNTLNPDLIVVVAYGKILPKYVLDFPKFGCINVHGSLLPNYRGAAPIQWSVINGDKITGVTTMFMDEGMDTGNMITKAEIEIDALDTYGTLHDKLMVLGANTLVKDLERLIANDGVLESTKQPEECTMAPMLEKDNTKLDFTKDVDTLVNLVRGTNPFPSAWCMIDEEKTYKIYLAERVELDADYSAAKLGEVVYLNDKKNILAVKCNDGYINLKGIKPAGSKLMQCGDYIRGGKIQTGELFI